MISDFPLTPVQLRRASYKLKDQMSDYMDKLGEDDDYTIKDFMAIATDYNWSMKNQLLLQEFANGYNNTSRYIQQRMINVFGALDFDDETISLLTSPVSMTYPSNGLYLGLRDLAEVVQDWRLKNAPEDVKDDPAAQLRNIRIAYRLADIAHNLHRELKFFNEYDVDHMLNYIQDLMSFVVNRSLMPGDGTRYLARFAYAVKNIDHYSLEFALNLYKRLHSEDFTVTDGDLELLTVFDLPSNLNERYNTFATEETGELCFYGVPLTWIDLETRERVSAEILKAAYTGAELTELLISQPLFMAYTLASVSEGIYNFALDEDNNPIDFTHAEGKVVVSYKGIPHDLEPDLDKESLKAAMLEFDIPFE